MCKLCFLKNLYIDRVAKQKSKENYQAKKNDFFFYFIHFIGLWNYSRKWVFWSEIIYIVSRKFKVVYVFDKIIILWQVPSLTY